VVVPDEQLSLAIGRRGQNVRLASQLTGWDIDILTEAEESERRQKEFAERSKLFCEALDVDEMVGQLLASEGFATIEEIAYVDRADVLSIEGFDEDTADELQNRARTYLERIENALKIVDKKMSDLTVVIAGVGAAGVAIASALAELKGLDAESTRRQRREKFLAMGRTMARNTP
jgi:N utilization substance protein A